MAMLWERIENGYVDGTILTVPYEQYYVNNVIDVAIATVLSKTLSFTLQVQISVAIVYLIQIQVYNYYLLRHLKQKSKDIFHPQRHTPELCLCHHADDTRIDPKLLLTGSPLGPIGPRYPLSPLSPFSPWI